MKYASVYISVSIRATLLKLNLDLQTNEHGLGTEP